MSHGPGATNLLLTYFYQRTVRNEMSLDYLAEAAE